MATLEQVEKLRERANVSYNEAKEALDAANGDLLEAMIYLEKMGKIKEPAGGGYYSSEKSGTAEKNENTQNNPPKGDSFSDLIKKFGRFCAKLIHKGNTNTFIITKNGENKASFPVTVLVLLLVFAFWITLPLLIIGLFFNYRYRFVGPDLGNEKVNGVMDSAANAADNLKKSVNDQTK